MKRKWSRIMQRIISGVLVFALTLAIAAPGGKGFVAYAEESEAPAAVSAAAEPAAEPTVMEKALAKWNAVRANITEKWDATKTSVKEAVANVKPSTALLAGTLVAGGGLLAVAVLSGGNGGGDNGNSSATPSPTPTPVPSEEPTENKTITITQKDEQGNVISEITVVTDEAAQEETTTKTNAITTEQVQEQGTVVAQEAVTTDATGAVTKIVRTYAIAADKLAEQENGITFSAAQEETVALPEDDSIVYVTVTMTYIDGELESVKVDYEYEMQEHSVAYNVDTATGEVTVAEGSEDDVAAGDKVLAIVGNSASREEAVTEVSSDAMNNAEATQQVVEEKLKEDEAADPADPTEKVYGIEDAKVTLKGDDLTHPSTAEIFVSGAIMEAVSDSQITTDITAEAELTYENGKLAGATAQVPDELGAVWAGAAGATLVAAFDCSVDGTVGVTVYLEQDGVKGTEYSGSISYADGKLTGVSVQIPEEGTVSVELEYDTQGRMNSLRMKAPDGEMLFGSFVYTGDKITNIQLSDSSNDSSNGVSVDIAYDGDSVSNVAVDFPYVQGQQGQIELTHTGSVLTKVTASFDSVTTVGTGIPVDAHTDYEICYDTAGEFESYSEVSAVDGEENYRITVKADGSYSKTFWVKLSEEKTVEIEETVSAGDVSTQTFTVDGNEFEETLELTTPERNVVLTFDDSGISYCVGEREAFSEWAERIDGTGARVEVDGENYWIPKEPVENSGYVESLSQNEDGTWTLYIPEVEVSMYKVYQDWSGTYGIEVDREIDIDSWSSSSVQGYGGISSDEMNLLMFFVPQLVKLADNLLPSVSQMLANGFVLD